MRDNHRKTNYVSIRFHEELVLDSYVKNKELTVWRGFKGPGLGESVVSIRDGEKAKVIVM
jgi:hypothetical protein